MIEITESIRQRIEEIKEFAFHNVVTINDTLDIMGGKPHPLMMNPGNKVLIKDLYAVTFTIDEWRVSGEIHKVAHVSVFMVNKEVPAMNVIRLIIDAFGFPDIYRCFSQQVNQHGCLGIDIWERKPV